jgi:hypothetical protein
MVAVYTRFTKRFGVFVSETTVRADTSVVIHCLPALVSGLVSGWLQGDFSMFQEASGRQLMTMDPSVTSPGRHGNFDRK